MRGEQNELGGAKLSCGRVCNKTNDKKKSFILSLFFDAGGGTVAANSNRERES